VSRPASAALWRTGIVALLVAGGVGAGFAFARHSDAEPTRSTAPKSAQQPVVCGRRGTLRPLPASFPRSVPLPRGTAITRVRRSHPRGFSPVLTVEGFIPGSLERAALFFLRELRTGGFQLMGTEAEPGWEAEGRFLGNGTSGGWRVRAARCTGGVALLIGVVLPR
jgi:hypothetical protein